MISWAVAATIGTAVAAGEVLVLTWRGWRAGDLDAAELVGGIVSAGFFVAVNLPAMGHPVCSVLLSTSAVTGMTAAALHERRKRRLPKAQDKDTPLIG